jgi:FHA domain-containing protein
MSAQGNAALADDPLLQAFLDGAQLRGLAVSGGLTPERMREIGQMLREAVHGVLDLLAARAQAKREVRADATVIVGRDNNPLKFAPSVEAAITHLVMPRGEGFMPPLRAVADAYASLQSHHQGFVAGMRAALGAVLARLDPRALQNGMEEESLADSLLPMNREAKLWDAFERLHAEVTREADADFHALFGREFLRAYQARVAGLGESGGGPPGS